MARNRQCYSAYNGVPAIEHTSKTGYMLILDRASGEPLIPYQEVAIPPTPANAAFQNPWPTQPVSSIESLTEHHSRPDAPGRLHRCSDVDYAGTDANGVPTIRRRRNGMASGGL